MQPRAAGLQAFLATQSTRRHGLYAGDMRASVAKPGHRRLYVLSVEKGDVGPAGREISDVARGDLAFRAAERGPHGGHVVEGQDGDEMDARGAGRTSYRPLADLVFAQARHLD